MCQLVEAVCPIKSTGNHQHYGNVHLCAQKCWRSWSKVPRLHQKNATIVSRTCTSATKHKNTKQQHYEFCIWSWQEINMHRTVRKQMEVIKWHVRRADSGFWTPYTHMLISFLPKLTYCRRAKQTCVMVPSSNSWQTLSSETWGELSGSVLFSLSTGTSSWEIVWKSWELLF